MVLSPSPVTFELCDLGQVNTLSEPPFLVHGIGIIVQPHRMEMVLDTVLCEWELVANLKEQLKRVFFSFLVKHLLLFTSLPPLTHTSPSTNLSHLPHQSLGQGKDSAFRVRTLEALSAETGVSVSRPPGPGTDSGCQGLPARCGSCLAGRAWLRALPGGTVPPAGGLSIFHDPCCLFSSSAAALSGDF